jgi:hypothetical protein
MIAPSPTSPTFADFRAVLGDALLAPRLDQARTGPGQPPINPFGPAAVIGRSTPWSIFVIYNAEGRLDSGLVPNPTVTPPTFDAGAGVPYAALYARSGDMLQQVQLNEQNNRLTGLYSIGYRLLV